MGNKNECGHLKWAMDSSKRASVRIHGLLRSRNRRHGKQMGCYWRSLKKELISHPNAHCIGGRTNPRMSRDTPTGHRHCPPSHRLPVGGYQVFECKRQNKTWHTKGKIYDNVVLCKMLGEVAVGVGKIRCWDTLSRVSTIEGTVKCSVPNAES